MVPGGVRLGLLLPLSEIHLERQPRSSPPEQEAHQKDELEPVNVRGRAVDIDWPGLTAVVKTTIVLPGPERHSQVEKWCTRSGGVAAAGPHHR